MRYLGRVLLLAVSVVAASTVTPAPSAAQAPEREDADRENADREGTGRDRIFRLGGIVVIGTREGGVASVGASLVTCEEMGTFERTSLDQAVNLAPGVVGGLSGNSRRNEPNIHVRGQDRWRVPLYLDGVRFYLPADNRIDFARFLTGNMAEVQIQKGYAGSGGSSIPAPASAAELSVRAWYMYVLCMVHVRSVHGDQDHQHRSGSVRGAPAAQAPRRVVLGRDQAAFHPRRHRA